MKKILYAVSLILLSSCSSVNEPTAPEVPVEPEVPDAPLWEVRETSYQEWFREFPSFLEPGFETLYQLYDNVRKINVLNDKMIDIMAKSNNKDQYIFSPLSLFVQLTELANISDARQSEEIISALGAANLQDLNVLCWSLFEYYDGIHTDFSYCRILNNHLWISEAHTPSLNVVESLGSNFNVGVELVDVESDKTYTEINDWMSKWSDDYIKEYISGNDKFKLKGADIIMPSAAVYVTTLTPASRDGATKVGSGVFLAHSANVICDFMENAYVIQSREETDEYLMLSMLIPGSMYNLNIYMPKFDLSPELIPEYFTTEKRSAFHSQNSQLQTCKVRLPVLNTQSKLMLDNEISAIGIPSIKEFCIKDPSIKKTTVSVLHENILKLEPKNPVRINQFDIPSGDDIVVNRPFMFELCVGKPVKSPHFMTGVVSDPSK